MFNLAAHVLAATFRRQGDPTRIASVAEILNTVISKVPDAQVMGDLDACAAWAAANAAAAVCGPMAGVTPERCSPALPVSSFCQSTPAAGARAKADSARS